MSAADPTWRVERGSLVLPSGNLMKGSCRHRKSGACGGCYARLVVALESIAQGEDAEIVTSEVFAAMKSEGKP